MRWMYGKNQFQYFFFITWYPVTQHGMHASQLATYVLLQTSAIPRLLFGLVHLLGPACLWLVVHQRLLTSGMECGCGKKLNPFRIGGKTQAWQLSELGFESQVLFTVWLVIPIHSSPKIEDNLYSLCKILRLDLNNITLLKE